MNDLHDLKAQAIAHVDRVSAELRELALDIHAHPELGFQEHRASTRLAETLANHGFATSKGTGGLETAFSAEHGDGRGPTIAILAEYDALPGVGHGCGHNLICTAAIGAGLAVRAAAPELPGKLMVVGTPAEEGGGGKVLLARAGVFEGVDAAMMFHPATRNIVSRGSKAMVRVKVEFFGKSAHASSAPDLGISALEAMVQLFVLTNGLRQHMRRDGVLHGIISDGGKAANVIPEYTSAEFSVRGNDYRYRDELVEKLTACANAAALATGCRAQVTPGMSYDNIVPNRALVEAFERNLEQLGISYVQPRPNERMGSTDMGDISQLMPAIHPYLAIADESVGGHSHDMARAAATDSGLAAMLNAAKALALTALDLLYEPSLVEQAKTEFNRQLEAGVVRGRVN
jgi:amidohydrolase